MRWEGSISTYEQQLSCLAGDAIVAAAFMSYAGPFPSEFRDELVRQTWLPQVGIEKSHLEKKLFFEVSVCGS